MADSIKELQKLIDDFNEVRGWESFQSPKDLALSISIEAAELLEIFQWSGADLEVKNKMEQIREELADVFIYCIRMASFLHLDISEIIKEKMILNGKKYPC